MELAVYSGQMFGALLTEHPKAFDCLDHELLIAKHNTTHTDSATSFLWQMELLVPGRNSFRHTNGFYTWSILVQYHFGRFVSHFKRC